MLEVVVAVDDIVVSCLGCLLFAAGGKIGCRNWGFVVMVVRLWGGCVHRRSSGVVSVLVCVPVVLSFFFLCKNRLSMLSGGLVLALVVRRLMFGRSSETGLLCFCTVVRA